MIPPVYIYELPSYLRQQTLGVLPDKELSRLVQEENSNGEREGDEDVFDRSSLSAHELVYRRGDGMV